MLIWFMPPNAILISSVMLIESSCAVDSGLEMGVAARKIEGCDAEVLRDHLARTLRI